MTGRTDDRGGDAGIWASLLDPVANARALGDVQAQALRAAGDLVERLARAVDGPEPDGPASRGSAGSGDEAGPGDDDATMAGDGARLVEAWIEILSRIAQSFGRPARDPSSEERRIDVDLAVGPSGALRLASDGATGQSPSGEAWLHNDSGAPVGPLALRATELVSSDGSPVGAVLSFDPSTIEEMPARSSRGAKVSATLGPTCGPGTYRGLVQIAGSPNGWFAVEIVVGDAAEATS